METLCLFAWWCTGLVEIEHLVRPVRERTALFSEHCLLIVKKRCVMARRGCLFIQSHGVRRERWVWMLAAQ